MSQGKGNETDLEVNSCLVKVCKVKYYPPCRLVWRPIADRHRVPASGYKSSDEQGN